MLKIVHIATLVLSALARLGIIGIQLTHEIEQSPYWSGYKHGITGDPLQADKHTQAFNQGYIDRNCSVNGKSTESDSDEGTFECSLETTQYKNSTG
jgi:hypothetical protein